MAAKMNLSMLALVVANLFSSVWAHGPDSFRPARAQHGGQVQTVGGLRLEGVADPQPSRLYVRDKQDRAVRIEGATGRALIWGYEQTRTVQLDQLAESFALNDVWSWSEVRRIIVTLNLPSRDPLQVTFKQAANTQ